MNNETAVMILEDYFLELKMKNERHYYKQALMEFAYSKWAALEILDVINVHPDENPVSLLEEFKRKIQKYASQGEVSTMFSVAYDVAEDVLDIFLAAI